MKKFNEILTEKKELNEKVMSTDEVEKIAKKIFGSSFVDSTIKDTRNEISITLKGIIMSVELKDAIKKFGFPNAIESVSGKNLIMSFKIK